MTSVMVWRSIRPTSLSCRAIVHFHAAAVATVEVFAAWGFAVVGQVDVATATLPYQLKAMPHAAREFGLSLLIAVSLGKFS